MSTKKKSTKTATTKLEKIAEGHVAGLQFHDYAPGLIKVTPRDLELYHERSNAYDARAIAIYITVDGAAYKLGYVSKSTHSILWQHKERGNTIRAKVVEHDKAQPLWHRLKVEYYIEVPLKPVLERF